MQNKNTTIVLLHGWGGKASGWSQNEVYLQSLGYKTIPVEMPGFDLPDPPVTWGIPEYADHVFNRIRSQGINGPVILVGHSFGGRIAIYLSAQRKDFVKGLILTDAAGINLESNPLKGFVIKMSGLARTIETTSPTSARISKKLRGVILKIIGSKNYKDANPTMREVMKKVVDLDLRDMLPNISCPTLVIWGEKDTVTPLNMAYFMHRNIPKAKLVILKGGDHWVNLKMPNVWNEAVGKFLSEQTL